MYASVARELFVDVALMLMRCHILPLFSFAL